MMKQPYPRIILAPLGPTQKFREWVRQFGVSRLSRSLGINRSAVHSWITQSGIVREPVKDTARTIVALSKIEPLKGRGKLTLEDIYGDAQAAQVEMRA